jgi:hypothetical protein
LADPPAESPSTRKISVPLFPWMEQSASLPGKVVFFLFIFFSIIWLDLLGSLNGDGW